MTASQVILTVAPYAYVFVILTGFVIYGMTHPGTDLPEIKP